MQAYNHEPMNSQLNVYRFLRDYSELFSFKVMDAEHHNNPEGAACLRKVEEISWQITRELANQLGIGTGV